MLIVTSPKHRAVRHAAVYTQDSTHTRQGSFRLDNTPVGQIGLAYSGSGYAMDPRVITMQQLFKMAGYRTGHIGKLHVFPEASFPFDYRGPASLDGPNIKSRDIGLMAQLAGEFLVQPPQQPFFLTMCYFDPHQPYFTQVKNYPQPPYGATEVPPFPWIGTADTPALRQEMAGIYNGIARMDAGVGMLLNKLTQLGLDSNTIVIFTGDNGPAFYGKAKTTCYEAGLRVPMIMRYPGQISPNRVKNSLVSTVDIMPTVLQAAGVTVPQNLAGRSLIQLFQENTTDWRHVLCAEYTSHTRANFRLRRCIRDQRYKLILNLLPNRMPNRKAEELYDLATDQYEFSNLAGKPEHQAAGDFLRGELLKWRQQTADPLLDPAVLAAMEQEHYGP